jgi:WD40 repeat protein
VNEVLYCSQKDGAILLWNLKTDTEKRLNDCRDSEDEVHTGIVIAMITIPKLHFMASGDMDGKVILWDTINNKAKWVYK